LEQADRRLGQCVANRSADPLQQREPARPMPGGGLTWSCSGQAPLVLLCTGPAKSAPVMVINCREGLIYGYTEVVV
jgi:hypothetical protein